MKKLVACLLLFVGNAFAAKPLSLVVMDPLAAPLSCPCVEGYAQRDYDALGKYLSDELGRPVTVTFAESLENALAKSTCPHVDLVIGKESVAWAQSEKLELELTPLAKLTGKDGRSTQTGLIIVRSGDPAQKVSDLAGYRVLYGPEDCVEKFGAARDLLALAGVDVIPAKQAETSAACSDGACKIIEWGDTQKGAAVISSYAAPLLEGCGTVKKGDLRVVGETKPVPFIVAFASQRLSADEQAAVQQALLGAVKSAGMLQALESMLGFVPLDQEDVVVEPTTTEAPQGEKNTAWPGWLGPQRNGHCDWLPSKLPEPLNVVWRHPLARPGLGGLAATEKYVLLGDRDAANMADVFRCLSTETGAELWAVTYPAPGQLDYDNSPRATPLIVGDRAIFFGAFGDLTCADLATGLPLWRMNIRQQFGAMDELPWGTCSSPLVVDDTVVVNPGAPDASLVALSIADGTVKWQTPGEPQGYGSLNLLKLGGGRQIVGHTQTLLCGWNPETGELLWEYQPPNEGDFNVPTPIEIADQLLVCTENNAARLFAFDESGRIVPEPVAVCETLATDTCTPVARDCRVFCASGQLLTLDANDGLKVLAILKDDAFTDYAPLLISAERLLVQARGGELLLVDTTGDEPRIVSRAHLAADEDRAADLYTAPAIVGTRLFVRTEREVVCVELDPDQRTAHAGAAAR
jgi:outer membrane protein assembly factor BamB/ABC-type phosphate/phosphonate transport system substrate-binding protein